MTRKEKQILLILLMLIVFTALIFASAFNEDINAEPAPMPTAETVALQEYLSKLDEALDEKIENLTELNEILAERIEVQRISRSKQAKEMIVEATAYTAGFESTGKNPGDDAYGITKSGFEVDSGVIAVDPAVIPLGSICWVEGYGYALALDIGGAIKGNKIDVYFHDVTEARQWGRRQGVRVRVYE